MPPGPGPLTRGPAARCGRRGQVGAGEEEVTPGTRWALVSQFRLLRGASGASTDGALERGARVAPGGDSEQTPVFSRLRTVLTRARRFVRSWDLSGQEGAGFGGEGTSPEPPGRGGGRSESPGGCPQQDGSSDGES